jgi:hypothetical protein
MEYTDSQGGSQLMEATLKAVEMTGTVDEHHQLRLDGALPIPSPTRVRVIVLYPLTDEWNETEWMQAAARNPTFEYLKEAAEDVYTVTDGKPFHDKA